MYVSYLNVQGRFNPSYAHAAEFTRSLKSEYPELQRQAWLGLPLDQPCLWLRGQSGYVNLADPSTRQYMASFCAELMRAGGFDGVHRDAEPIPTGDADVRKCGRPLGQRPCSRSPTPKLQPILGDWPLPWVGRELWQPASFREVARRVNQVAVMSYDTGLPLAGLYRLYQRHEVIALSQAVDGLGTELFVGVPTWEERTLSHWPNAENMESGLAMPPDGETDAREWRAYEALWLGSPIPR